MSTLFSAHWPPEEQVPLAARVLDQAIGKAGQARGRARTIQSSVAWLSAVRWGSAAVLAAGGALGSYLGHYDMPVHFAILWGGMAVMLHCWHQQKYAVPIVMGHPALAGLPGGWQGAFVLARAAPLLFATVVPQTARTAGR